MQLDYCLQRKIKYLLKQYKLLIIRVCASAWQNEFVAGIVDNRNAIDLSDSMIREQALRQPGAFVEKIKERTVLYNLEYVLDVLPCLSAADVPNGTFIALVNQSYYLRTIVESLESVALLDLPVQVVSKDPFLPSNSLLIQSEEYDSGDVADKIFNGRLSPNRFTDVEDRDRFYANYLKNFLYRVIRDLTTVSDDMRFYRFVCAVASSVGHMVNYANLGNAADISSPTAKQWLAFLEGTGVVYLLDPIEHGSLKRVAKAPKLYFADTGLVAYLLRINSVEELNESAFFGALFENYVVNAIKDSYIANGFDIDLSYFRDSNAKEIDLLLRYNNVIYPIDIGREPFVTSKLQKKFRLINDIEQDGISRVGIGCVIGPRKRMEPLADDLWYVPVGSLG